MNWIRNLRFGMKMTAIIAAMLVPLALLMFFFTQSVQRSIDTGVNEAHGADYFEPIESVLLPLADHEAGAVLAVLGSGEGRFEQSTAAVDAKLAELASNPPLFEAPDGVVDAKVGALRSQWSQLRAAEPRSARDVLAQHRAFKDQVLAYRDWVASNSGMALDPSPDTYYLIDSAVVQIPNFNADVSTLRALALAATASQASEDWVRNEIARVEARITSSLDSVEANLNQAAQGGPGGAAAQQKAVAPLQGLREQTNRLVRLMNETVLVGKPAPPVDEVLAATDQITQQVAALHDGVLMPAVREQLAGHVAAERGVRNLVLGIVGTTIVFALFFTWLIVNTTLMRLTASAAAIVRMADGDYAQPVAAEGKDELGQMLASIESMRARVASVLQEVQGSSMTVSTASREINEGTADLASRTEQQAANLEETASSMEEVTSTVKQNAENAVVADKLAQTARQQAEQGGTVAVQAVSAMSSIQDSSRKIADIIAVIDEIAFQTNLLALNAAVEAARAGDQGRGFAVVASEVRSLAQRSATAAREIKGLIQDSVQRVEEGGRLVGESGKLLGEIVTAVKKVSDIVGEISAASREQAAGVEEISRAVMQMDEGTQQNAAMVEQATAAAASMNEQARKLADLTGFFKLGAAAAAVGSTSRLSVAQAGGAASSAAAVPAARSVQPVTAPAKHVPTGGVERRAATRPWSGGAQGGGDKGALGRLKHHRDAGDGDAGRKPTAAAASSSGEDWEHF
jgi:methyl-accepting chemotaxis protein